MEDFDRQKHWEQIYQTKELKDVSWFQPKPETSLSFFENVPLTARVIDIGGGDSFLVDHLLDLGYQDVSVLDISASAIERAKLRLGNRAEQVKWIISDVTTFQPAEKYDFWHDRAAFHFLVNEKDISNYIKVANESLNSSGILVIGTFSEQGPTKCSGIEIRQYSETSLSVRFNDSFEKIDCIRVDHQTPFDSIQNFVFCSFRKLNRL